MSRGSYSPQGDSVECEGVLTSSSRAAACAATGARRAAGSGAARGGGLRNWRERLRSGHDVGDCGTGGREYWLTLSIFSEQRSSDGSITGAVLPGAAHAVELV